MLIDIKQRLGEEPIRELLSYSIFPDPEILEEELNAYAAEDGRELYGYEDKGQIIGVVGFIVHQNGLLEVNHLAVHPEYRGQGYGRGQILELIELKKPIEIHAETDEESVEFFRNIGFSITSLGEKFTGVECFQCIYDVETQE
ncbi:MULTISPECIES: GNAT family N-acetyltransferase [unclassified Paenibacillus]|uniref:GNAT family N-acetyltransferase n=1 Tax=unclassified Paenibacillus TaxID=185978 RepID=UPI001AE889AE|nr:MULTISPECIES: GNAT family N-acetyltransferase [unclassified Paenibacillus]MBP1155657.1 N-acetylglutamate synthase-like GNAT family acetyltransferase [Paenibacillus sp. PvP091]MBP1168957.1 N-acetylglutamate synthase-like GNAT family acetyltransferase [Paenibacillus sp. PvR098]MBP2439985.1 N-acetylglutamate synthase-like GNAT family acetyltransferase [Paenibacillus sp. PvP052]